MWNKLLRHPAIAQLKQAWHKLAHKTVASSASKASLPEMPEKLEHLDERFFLLTLLAAVVIHIIGIYLYNLIPAQQTLDIPVHALSIKLGDDEPSTPEEQKPAQPAADNKNDVENALSKSVVEPDQQAQERAKSVVNSMEKAMNGDDNASKALDKAMSAASSDASSVVAESARKLSNIAKQFVRTNAMQAPSAKGSGSVMGNSTAKEAEMMSRYEQLISLWIEKFKLYPDEARSQGMQGETVIRIRIDRQGNIRYYILERSTGFQILDRAAIDMVKRANPVPAVPNDYPPGDLIEFLIPVNFHLQ